MARARAVGSYNLDPRSADIDTEVALLVDSPAFAEMVAEFFGTRATSTNAPSRQLG